MATVRIGGGGGGGGGAGSGNQGLIRQFSFGFLIGEDWS